MPGDITGLGFLGSLFATEPKVPKFKPIDTTKEQASAVSGNIANFGDVSKLAGDMNTFNQDQLNKMLASAVPGYQNMLQGIGDRIGGFLNGEIPKDVSDQIGRNAAYQSLSGGFGGSGMARNLVARDLGMTSLDLIGKGIDAGTRWLATARQNAVAPQFDPSSMFITPAQRIATTEFNTTGKFQRDWMQNQLDSQYSLGTKFSNAMTDLGQGITGLATSAAGSLAGGAGGGI